MSLSLKLAVSGLFLGLVFAQTIPTVTTRPTYPSNIPAGLKVVCSTSSTDTTQVPCPVLLFNGFTYWAFSYLDNRSAMDIVAYDPSGNPVQQFPFNGSRYVWQITVNSSNQTVTFYGQAIDLMGTPGTITVNWSQLQVTPLATTPVPASIWLALIGLAGASSYTLLRRRRA